VEKFVALLFSGIAEGAVISLAAIGLMLLHKASGIINFAHGDLITLGAYLAIWLSQDVGMPLIPGYLLTMLIMFAVGLVMDRLAVAPLRGKSVHVVVIATLGLALALRSLLGIWQGTNTKAADSPAPGVSRMFDAAISHQRLWIIIMAGVVVTLVIFFFNYTAWGRQMRAVAADRGMARLAGVRAGPLSMTAFGFSAVLAGLAGVLIAPLAGVDLTLGFGVMLNSFAAMIIGGFGSLPGVVIAAMMIGLLERLLGGYWFVNYSSILPFIFMILAIAYRPQGLFGAKENATRL
jgi:branched-chain amino acid transport system permease protein